MNLKLLSYPKDATALRTPGKFLSQDFLSSDEFCVNLEAMKTILMESKDGVGLAATQAGWGIQLFVLNINQNQDTVEPQIYINPKLISQSKKQIKDFEGCLSVKGLYLEIPRPVEIEWEYMDLNWVKHSTTSKDFFARAVLHEIDHLNGKLLIDRAGISQQLKIKKWLKANESN